MHSLNHTASRILVVAVALAGALACETPRWTEVSGDLTGAVLSVDGSSLDDLYIVGGPLGSAGEALFMTHDENGWTTRPTGFAETLWWVWRAGPSSAYAAGEGGVIVHWDGAALTTMDTPTTETLFGIWGSSETDIWAVGGVAFGPGDTDVLLHYDGAAWTSVTPPEMLGVAFFKVWGSAADDVWVVGQDGAALHYDGSAWSVVATGSTVDLFTVHGRSATDVWAVGGPPDTILRWDGGAWTELTDKPDFGNVLNGVAVNANGEVMICGSSGTKWFRDADGVFTDDFVAPPALDLHAAWLSDNGERVVVGGNFNSPTAPVRIGVVGYYGTSPPGF